MKNIIPPTIQSTTIYPLRNGRDIIVPFCRLSLTQDSFIPSTIRQWNNLDESVRNLDSISKFKSAIRRESHLQPIPKYLMYGPRKLNITLTQLRHSASFLNDDLYKVNIVNNATCSCGAPRETVYHYLLECNKYSNTRAEMLNSLRWLPNKYKIDVNFLTNGNTELDYEQNLTVMRNVYRYIKGTKRFLIV